MSDVSGNKKSDSVLDIETQCRRTNLIGEDDLVRKTKEIKGNMSENGDENGRTYKTLRLRYHIKSNLEDNEAECEVCRERFSNKKNLILHMYFAHPECNGISTCNICNKTFKQVHNLKTHMKQAHAPLISSPTQHSQPHSTCNCECHTMAHNLTTGIKQLDLKIDAMQSQLDLRIKSMQNQLSNISCALTRISQTLTLQPPIPPSPPAHSTPEPTVALPSKTITFHSLKSKKTGNQCLLCGFYITSTNLARHYSRRHPSYLGGCGSQHPKYPENFYIRTAHPVEFCPPNLRPPSADLDGVESLNRRFLGLDSANSGDSKAPTRTTVSPPRIRGASGRFVRRTTRT